jgi:hypothetical protein
MTEKEKSAVDEYMARPDLPETLKATNREFIGSPDDWALAIEVSAAKAAPLASELAKWQALAQSPWEAPGGLLDAMAALERDYPVTLPLSLAIDLMAFGNEAAPPCNAIGGQMETGARRRRARQALMDAAGQAKFPLEHGPDCLPIKPGRFKFIQGPGSDGDSLEFNDLKEGEPDKRLHVVQIVDAGKFYAWLCERCGGPRKEGSISPKIPTGARVIPTQPFHQATVECVRLALLATDPFNVGYVTRDWKWPRIAEHIGEVYQREMKKRNFPETENKVPTVAAVRRVFKEC